MQAIAGMILTGRYVAPVDAPVIEHGAIAVRKGCVAAVGTAREVGARPDHDVIDCGQAVICPGFVNAHTHLELSFLAGQVPPAPDFIGWLLRLAARLNDGSLSREEVQESMRTGVTQSLSAGVTTVGDITRWPQWTRAVLAKSPLGGVSFGEVIAIGARRTQLEERLDTAATPMQTECGTGTPACRVRSGISPHAPYSVEPEALRACAIRAKQVDAWLCMHLAESPDEEAFTRFAQGPFATLLRGIGVWDSHVPVSGCGPVELAQRTGVLGGQTLLAHANYVSDADIGRLAAAGASVAYCPRTHRAFGHRPHRFADMLAAGVNVCIGTDSLASNPSLSVLEELRFLRREHPDLPSDELLAMGTLRGARALGLADLVGSITVGKRADLAVVPLGFAEEPARWDAMFTSCGDPVAVYTSGVHGPQTHFQV